MTSSRGIRSWVGNGIVSKWLIANIMKVSMVAHFFLMMVLVRDQAARTMDTALMSLVFFLHGIDHIWYSMRSVKVDTHNTKADQFLASTTRIDTRYRSYVP